MRTRRKILWAGAGLLTVAIAGGMVVAYRTYRMYSMVRDWESQIRYLVETGNTIGEAPAAEALSTDYLESIFGDNPELLDKLKSVVQRGLSEEPSLNLGEVAAMVVTYHKPAEDQVSDVVAHAIGGFPPGKVKPGFHRDGYFAQQLDRTLWNSGNLLLGFLGRDMVLFSDEKTAETQQEILEAIFTGNIMPLVNTLNQPLYFTVVFPEPRRIVPPQLRNHIQAIVLKGFLANKNGRMEGIFLTSSGKSAAYTFSLVSDMKTMAEVLLQTRWGGMAQQTEWGPQTLWWAEEMVQTLKKSTMEKQQSLVRVKADFGRIMVNAVLKSLERMGRDLAMIRGSIENRQDPRLVVSRIKSGRPSDYWSGPHEWGPDWPIPADPTNKNQQATTITDETAGAPATAPTGAASSATASL